MEDEEGVSGAVPRRFRNPLALASWPYDPASSETIDV